MLPWELLPWKSMPQMARKTECLIWSIWLVVSTPLKNMKVSWDDYSQYMEKMFQTTNQLIEYCFQNLPFSIKIGGMNLHESQQFGTILGTVW
jgi:hypothetical protein